MRGAVLLAFVVLAGCLHTPAAFEGPRTLAAEVHCPADLASAPVPPQAPSPAEAPDLVIGTPETPLGSVPPPDDLPLLSNASLVLRHRHFLKATLVDLASDPDTGEPWVVTLEGRVLRGARMQDEILNRSAEVLPLDKEAGLLSAETIVVHGAPRLAVVEATPALVMRLVSFPLVGEPGRRVADVAAPQVHFERTQATGYHFGGDLVWHDGALYLALGDGQTLAPDGTLLAARDDAPFGKVLRIDPETGANQTLARGLRNPWRIALDPACDRLFVADVGELTWEEVNVLPLSSPTVAHFGWDEQEGPVPAPATDATTATNATDAGNATQATTGPLLVYGHEQGRCAIAGGAFRPRTAGFLPGVFLFSDWCTGELWAYDPGTAAVTLLADLPAPIFAVRTTARGETWVLTADWESWAGEVLVLAPAAPAPRPPSGP